MEAWSTPGIKGIPKTPSEKGGERKCIKTTTKLGRPKYICGEDRAKAAGIFTRPGVETKERIAAIAQTDPMQMLYPKEQREEAAKVTKLPESLHSKIAQESKERTPKTMHYIDQDEAGPDSNADSKQFEDPDEAKENKDLKLSLMGKSVVSPTPHYMDESVFNKGGLGYYVMRGSEQSPKVPASVRKQIKEYRDKYPNLKKKDRSELTSASAKMVNTLAEKGSLGHYKQAAMENKLEAGMALIGLAGVLLPEFSTSAGGVIAATPFLARVAAIAASASKLAAPLKTPQGQKVLKYALGAAGLGAGAAGVTHIEQAASVPGTATVTHRPSTTKTRERIGTTQGYEYKTGEGYTIPGTGTVVKDVAGGGKDPSGRKRRRKRKRKRLVRPRDLLVGAAAGGLHLLTSSGGGGAGDDDDAIGGGAGAGGGAGKQRGRRSATGAAGVGGAAGTARSVGSIGRRKASGASQSGQGAPGEVGAGRLKDIKKLYSQIGREKSWKDVSAEGERKGKRLGKSVSLLKPIADQVLTNKMSLTQALGKVKWWMQDDLLEYLRANRKRKHGSHRQS